VFWTPGWLARHTLAVLLIVGFLWLGQWQIGRAAEGNLLSYGYAVEWPVFAGFVAFVWYREVRRALAERAAARGDADAPTGPAPLRPRRPRHPVAVPSAPDDGDDPQLAAYNRYLAWLAANPDAKPSDYRGDV
jgi:hypothetical protein